jgi:hypothetical protein
MATQTIDRNSVGRISVLEAHDHLAAGKATLVCAYDDAEKCRKYALPGAQSLGEFKLRAGSIPEDREIIFYCA